MTARHLAAAGALAASFLATAASHAAPATLPSGGGPHPWCDSSPTKLAEVVARHLAFERRLAREEATAERKASSAPQVDRSGDVAVIEDDGSLISEANPFDLAGSGLRFKRRRDQIRASRTGAAISPSIGERLAIGDDDSVEVALPGNFKLRFYGERYDRMFVNSDGNVTFVAGDNASTERNLGRFLGGPPRIAPFFADLDPSAVSGDRGVFLSVGNVVRITWMGVPEFGTSNRNTFQLTLFKNGRIQMSYGDLDAQAAVVGVSPGGGSLLELLDYSADLPHGPDDAALAERFSLEQEVDDVAVARTFLEHFADDYEHLIVWLDFPQSLGQAFAFEFNVKNEVRGIGLAAFDFSEFFGSGGGLASYLQMGHLGNYPPNPDTEFLGTNSTLDVLGQESGHRWLAYVRFRDRGGNASNDLLGRDLAHWSFFHDSDASDMEGNDIRDNGDGSFTTVASTDRYSALDQYLMGLRPASQVPGFFYVRDVTGTSATPASNPQRGVTFRGQRVNVSIGDVIAAEGPRVPSTSNAPDRFNMAFILLGKRGERPSQASIAHLDAIRARWERYFRDATDGRGRVSTELRLK